MSRLKLTNNSCGRFGSRRSRLLTPPFSLALLLFLGLTTVWVSKVLAAAPGDLDLTFGSGGKVVTDLGSEDQAHAVAVQSDGKIVVAGLSNGDFALARYNRNGSLDTSFDGDGKVTTDFGSCCFDKAYDVAIQTVIEGGQPVEKIVAVGQTSQSGSKLFAVARYNTDGSLDTTFDGDGKVTTAFIYSTPNFTASLAVAYGVAIQPGDNKIVVAGKATSNISSMTFLENDDFALARYNLDGSLDTTFDGDGKLLTNFGYSGAGSLSSLSNDIAYDVAIQSDGKIVAAGEAYLECPAGQGRCRDFGLARYLPNGLLDVTFGLGGTVTTDFRTEPNRQTSEFVQGIAIQPDGNIVAAGQMYIVGTSERDFALARYTSVGILDITFGSQGKVITDIFSYEAAPDVIIQSDDKIVIAGSSGDEFGNNYGFTLARYNTDGSPDTSFGTNGKVNSNFGECLDKGCGLALQNDGKLVVAGRSFGDFGVARFHLTASPSPTACDFDGEGTTDFAVFRPGDGFWYILRQDGGMTFTQFGASGDVPVPGDYDGDGKTDLAVWRNGTFYVLRSTTNTFTAAQWGQSGDDPTVTRDYDGDGRADFAVYRRGASSGDASYWHILYSSDNTYHAAQWGSGSDLPAPGDYDGDGRADLSVKRPGTSLNDPATFYTLLSATNSWSTGQWGFGSDRSVPGDYDGDGQCDIAVWRPSNGTFYVKKSSDGGLISQQWGLNTDHVVPGDYDQDGKTDFAVWRASDATFYVLKSSGGTIYQPWGTAGDIPVAVYAVH
jgi:uncharacterized delta-60 repeat protein